MNGTDFLNKNYAHSLAFTTWFKAARKLHIVLVQSDAVAGLVNQKNK